MAFKDYIKADPLYVRLDRLCEELEAKMDRVLYAKGKAGLFLTRLKWLTSIHEKQMLRQRELRVRYDAEVA